MDYTAFYEKTAKQLFMMPRFLHKHGIPSETVKNLNIGGYNPHYDETSKEIHDFLIYTQGKDDMINPTLIIPFDETFWIGIDTETGAKKIPPVSAEVRKKAILGKADLYTVDRPIWLAASVMDWLALKGIGANAVYLDTFGEAELIRILTEKPSSEAIICIPPDSESSTRGSCEGMADKIRDAGIPATVPEIPEGWGGASKMLMEDAGGLRAYIEDTEKAVIEGKTAERQRYNARSARDMAARFMAIGYTASPVDAIPTGLEELDKKLDGGLYPGLYIVGAMSSLGKTSLMLQIADTIAATDTDVLFFTAEQSTDELLAKSLSRVMGEMLADGSIHDALKPREIMGGVPRWGANTEALEKAVERYKAGAGHLWIIEDDNSREADGRGTGARIGVDTIKKAVSEHIEITGRYPVVIVDYLQILQPADPTGKKSDKQNMDETVSELRRLSKASEGGRGIPVLAISSLNRQSYGGPIDMDAFKESGAIEYGSDVILTLQPPGLTKVGKNAESNNAKAYEALESLQIKNMEIHILKNRMGERGKIPVSFDSRYGLFLNRPTRT